MEQEQPFVSIIIATHNRPEKLAACLGSLAGLDYPRGRFEVIVVQDGGEQPLDAVVAAVRDRLAVTLVAQRHAGPATARNTGAAHARGESLVFIDDDCTPRVGWLRALAARLAAAPDRAVGGQTLNALPDNVYSTASHLLVDYLYGYYNADHDRAHFLASNNLALPAVCFRAIGGFDARFPFAAAEDRDICDRWLDHGYAMTYAPEAVSDHSHTLAFGSFWRQHFTYGRGAFSFHRARARRGGRRISIEPLRFYLGLLRYPLARSRDLRGLKLAGLLMMSQMANAAGFAWQRLHSRF